MIALFVLLMLERADHVRCAPGYYVNGVRRSGVSQCIRAPRPGEAECAPGKPCDDIGSDDAPRYTVRVVCERGSEPRVVGAGELVCAVAGTRMRIQAVDLALILRRSDQL